MRRRTTLVMTALLTSALMGWSEVRETERKLAGDRDHTWVYARMEVVMGGDGRCKAGETWRFRSNHTAYERSREVAGEGRDVSACRLQ